MNKIKIIKAVYLLGFLLLPCVNGWAGGINLKIESQAASEMCMDVQGNKRSDGATVYMFKCHGRPNQRWAVTTDANGQSTIIGTGGFCLDLRGTHSKKDGTPIQMWKCHFGPNQRFNIVDGTIKDATTGRCVMPAHEKNGAPIVVSDCEKTKTEQWKFVE